MSALERLYGHISDALARVVAPIHTRADGLLLYPHGYQVLPPAGLRRHEAERVTAAACATIDALDGLLRLWPRHRLIAVTVPGPAAVATAIDPDEGEAGEIKAVLPLTPTALALLDLADWRPYASLAELVAAPDLRIDERDRAVLTRLRFAKSAELDHGAVDGVMKVSWSAKGAETASIPRALVASLPTIEDGEGAIFEISEPIELRPGDPLPQVRLRTTKAALLARMAQAVAEDLHAAFHERLGAQVFAGSIRIERFAR
jgi:hypothetical protein